MKNILGWTIGIILAIGLIFQPRIAYGIGYEVTEQHTRAMGFAGAFTARADDPSAVYYNTAGIPPA